MSEPVLFEGYEPPLPGDVQELGRDAQRTANQKALIAQGVHPATKRRVPDSGGRTCGDCAHLWVKSHTGGRWFKCDVTPYAYDMRKWWPACDRFTEVSGDA